MKKKEVRKPASGKKVADVPIIMQLEALECGAASLTMIMAYYGKWVPLEQVRVDCGVSRNGSNAKNICKAAAKYGFKTKGYAYNVKKLREKGKFPAIIHWGGGHFVVLDGFRGNKAILNDPAKGLVKLDLETFDKFFTGIYIEFTPTEEFEPGGKRKSVLAFARKRLKGAAALIAFFAITTIVFYLFAIVDPVMNQVFVDYLLGGNNPDWLLPFIFIFGGIGLLQVIVTTVQCLYQYKIRGKLDLIGSTTYMWKILRMPIDFFSQRMVGDLQQRQNENASIAETLVNVFAPLLFNTIMLVVYLVVMINKSWILTLIGVATVLINIFVSQYISKVRINISRVQARDNARLGAMTSKGIEMIETIKSSGAEDGFFEQWAGYKDAVTTNNKKLSIIRNVYSFIPGLIYLAINYGIMFLAVALTIQGKFTLGAMVGFQGLLAAFMTPAMAVITSGQSIQETRTQMERVDDVMEYKDDPYVIRTAQKTSNEKIKPSIEIQVLTFGYNIQKDPLIQDFNLSIKEGEKVAIVGKTGCGKSTLAKLISGLYQPWSGQILFDGKPIMEINRETFTDSVAVVDQDVFLFEDTIMNNLKMWNQGIQEEEVYRACKDAEIYDDIMARPHQFDSPVLEGGKNLSGGERQRMEIARALARNPSILILDEATSALDAKTEDNIVQAVKKRGITCIVIAHRLSTIRDADKILVLSGGKVVETGNHEELLRAKGYYYNLVTKE